MGSPRPPGAADRLLRSRAPRARRLADERRAFGARTDFVTPARLKRFASLSKRARRSITSFSRPRSRSLSSSRVVIVDERSLSLSLARGSTRKKDTEDADGTTRTVSVVPRRDALTSRRTADRSRATEFESRMAIHSSSSSTSARARRAVAQDVASRVKRIDASRHYAAQIIEILVEMTRADDARERRRRARVRARGQIIFRARYRRVVGGRRASREGGGRSEWETRARGWVVESTHS